MLDPRVSVIDKRLRNIGKVIVVSSGKGGVGKSLIASTLALILTRKGFKTGLFDLDFTSPTTHIVLGINDLHPTEEEGIIPAEFNGLKYMSLIFYLGGRVSPLRGSDLSNIFLELLAVTRWGNLDFLIIDMPPGISDLLLDILKYIKRANFLVVSSSSRMAFETVKKMLGLLRDLKVSIIGVVENMKRENSTYIKYNVEALGEVFLGAIFFDAEVENALGNVDELLKTRFAKEVNEIISKTPKIQL
jgi:ATP-binding protein involved in chromosome partitioning